jgi:hypothetical protein
MGPAIRSQLFMISAFSELNFFGIWPQCQALTTARVNIEKSNPGRPMHGGTHALRCSN